MAPWWDKAGRPKTPSDYRWQSDDHPDLGELSTEDKSFRDVMALNFHRAGLNGYQVRVIENAHIQHLKTFKDAQKAMKASAKERATKELSSHWGSAMQQKLAVANRALFAHAGAEANALAGLTLSDGSSLANNAMFARFLANVGERTPTKAGSPDNAIEQIAKIRRLAEREGLSPTSKNYPNEELQRLYEQAYGTAPLETSGHDSGVGRRRR